MKIQSAYQFLECIDLYTRIFWFTKQDAEYDFSWNLFLKGINRIRDNKETWSLYGIVVSRQTAVVSFFGNAGVKVYRGFDIS